MTNRLRLWIQPSPDTNDHEARIEIDGADWLDPDVLGLDPPDLLRELSQPNGGTLLVGRCGCGVIGCGDVTVRLHRDATTVAWRSMADEGVLAFDASDYDAEVARFASDHAWEDLGRTVERLVGDLFAGLKTRNGSDFQWASTRIAPGRVHASFTNTLGHQSLYDFGWDGTTVESAVLGARSFQQEHRLKA
jgi:hypothetical protein